MRIYDVEKVPCPCGKNKIESKSMNREFIGYLALGVILLIAYQYHDIQAISTIGILGLIVWGYYLWKMFKEGKP